LKRFTLAIAAALWLAPAAHAACGLPPAKVVRGQGRVQVVAVQYKQSIPATASYASIERQLDCYFATYAAPYRRAGRHQLVVFDELNGLTFGLAGSRGALARAFAATPLATAPGQLTDQPLGALAGAVGLVGAAYARPLAFYATRFPGAYAGALLHDLTVIAQGGIAVPAAFVFLAATDTYVRAFVQNFSTLARRYHTTVAAGGLLPVLMSESQCAANGYPGWVACPGWRTASDPGALAALSDPDLPDVRQVYEAVAPTVTNATFFFAPDGRLYDVQPKVNLTPVELELGWQAAPPSTIHVIRLYRRRRAVRGVRIGDAISLDAFEHARPQRPCSDPHAYVACLARERANLLLQPDFNDATANCASWADYQSACRSTPVWQPLEWMFSSWYDLEARRAGGRFLYPSFRYAVNPLMVGNIFDITGDGQTAIFGRGDRRAHRGFYIGDSGAAQGPYPDPTGRDSLSSKAAPTSLRGLDGPRRGFLAELPWVLPATVTDRDSPSLPAGSAGSLESCTDGLAPGSGVRTGPCAENGYLPGAIVANLRLAGR
jgi:predicted amidohydrolase